MTEWTSISLKKAQKERLLTDKPEDMSMGSYLVKLCDENEINEGCIDPADVEAASFRGAKQAVEEGIEHIRKVDKEYK